MVDYLVECPHELMAYEIARIFRDLSDVCVSCNIEEIVNEISLMKFQTQRKIPFQILEEYIERGFEFEVDSVCSKQYV